MRESKIICDICGRELEPSWTGAISVFQVHAQISGYMIPPFNDFCTNCTKNVIVSINRLKSDQCFDNKVD